MIILIFPFTNIVYYIISFAFIKSCLHPCDEKIKTSVVLPHRKLDCKNVILVPILTDIFHEKPIIYNMGLYI